MFAVIRKIMTLLTSFIVIIVSLFSVGEFSPSVEMPALNAGELGQYVDPFTGTGGTPYMSGMTFPGAATPYGAVKLSPDTGIVGGKKLVNNWANAGYSYMHTHIIGFSHTRLSGTGAADMAHFRVTPTIGNRNATALVFSHDKEIATAGYYAVNLPEIGTMAELTATTHVGAHRYTFRTDKDARLYLDVTSFMPNGSSNGGEVYVNTETGEITGKATVTTQFAGRYGGLTAYFVAVFNKDMQSFTVVNGSEETEGLTAAAGDELGIDINFGSIKNDPLEMKLAISFVSCENAKENLAAEAADLDFEGVRAVAREAWEEMLGRITIEGTDDVKGNFYTSLYHAVLMPTSYTDVNGEYAGFKNTVGTADGYTYLSDMSLWDTFRNVNALQTLIAPEVQDSTLESLLDMADVYGIFPRWPSGTGETNSMFGSPADMVFTESYLKGFTDYDVQAAYEYMKTAAMNDYAEGKGRVDNDLYMEYGYCPADLSDKQCVSRTLEYCYADYCISLLAEQLGYTEDAEFFRNRSKNYENLWDAENLCFRAKNSDGTWNEPFAKNWISFVDDILGTGYSYGYCEGGARQWQWAVLYDTEALIALYGGDDAFRAELTEFMEDANEMRSALIPSAGYWHGNEHDLHAAYLFNDAGDPASAQKYVRWAMDTYYETAPDGIDGNDDGGTLSAWYVLSAIGIYPVAGTDEYWIGSPCVEDAVLDLGNGKTLHIKAFYQSEDNVYIQSVTLNGEKLTSPRITHEMLVNGGDLCFVMGNSPAENGGF